MNKNHIQEVENVTENSYNASASRYEKNFSGYEPYARQVLSFIGLLKPGCSILDIGCGPGINSRLLIDNGFKVTGIDFSENMISLAKKKCPEGEFFVSDIRDINLSERFDSLMLSFCIVHLRDSETSQLIKKLKDLVMVDGSLVYLSFMEGYGEGLEKTSFSESSIYFNYYTRDWIKKEFYENDFFLITENTENYTESDGSITNDIFMIFEYKAEGSYRGDICQG